MRTEFVNFKVSKQRHVGESQMEGECCDYVIISKKKREIITNIRLGLFS